MGGIALPRARARRVLGHGGWPSAPRHLLGAPPRARHRDVDEVLTRQCPCLGLSIHGASMGAWRIRRLQTKTGVHTNLPRFGPPEGKDLHPACLILYCLYSWSCYNGAQMGSGYGRKRWRVLACAWDLCEIRCLCEISLSRGCPWWLYICSQLGFTSSFCILLQVEMLGLAGFMYPSSGLLLGR
jgi:hypothetical protein